MPELKTGKIVTSDEHRFREIETKLELIIRVLRKQKLLR